MNKLSKIQWQERVIHVAKTLPKEDRPDDHVLMQLLMDVIVAEQNRVKDKNLAVLIGIAAVLLERIKTSIPAATHVTESGEPVYSEAEIADHLGVSLEEVQRVSTEIAKDPANAGLIYTDVDPRSLHRVN